MQIDTVDRGTKSSRSASQGNRRRWALRPVLLAWIVLFLLGVALPSPAVACTHPDNTVNIWIIINGTDVWIIVRGFHTAQVNAGATCGCGFQLVPALVSIQTVEVVDSVTREPVAGFGTFLNTPIIATSLHQFAQSGTWVGFSAPVNATINAGQVVDLEFHGKLVAGTTFETLMTQLNDLPAPPVGSGEADGNGIIPPQAGGPPVIPPHVGGIDQTTSSTSGSIVAMNVASPGSIELAVRDAEVGLKTLTVTKVDNAVVNVKPYQAGTRQPVSVTITAIDEKHPASATIYSCNTNQRCSTSRPTFMSMSMGSELRSVQTMSGLAPSLNQVFFQNGDPGVRMLALVLNGHRFAIRPLAAGQRIEADLSTAAAGAGALTCTARGEAGSRGLLALLEAQ